VPAGGVWYASDFNNDTYLTPPIAFGAQHNGTNDVFVSGATDLTGSTLNRINPFAIVVDAVAPAQPALSLISSNSSSATYGWSSYSAPADLNGFRVYLSTSSFTSVTGLTAIARLAADVRNYTFGGLALDTQYYIAVLAVDQAGNDAAPVVANALRLPSSVPPVITARVAVTGAQSALVSWNFDPSGLLGFAGFKLYFEPADFSTVAALTRKLIFPWMPGPPRWTIWIGPRHIISRWWVITPAAASILM